MSNLKNKLTFTALGTVALFSPFAALAENLEKVVISGNERVEETTVRNYLLVSEGEEFAAADTSKVLKALYRTGLFENVDVSFENNTLKIDVEENPLVNKVAFEGNDEVVDEHLQKAITLAPRAVYTADKVRRDVQQLLRYYRQSGRFLAKVKPQIIKRSQNRVDVIYKITEGEETKIQSIRFVGNEIFTDEELQTIVRSKESTWWRFITTADVYDPQRMEVDKELLRRHYIQTGYADFKVVSAVAELSRDKKDFHLTFTVSEGARYDFGEVDIAFDAVPDEDLNKEELMQSLAVEEGELYNGALVEESIDNLIDAFGTKGFAFLDVRPRFEQDEANRKIGVTFDVVPGPRVYVNRINIEGNTRTRDHVIRRQVRLAEGDAFSTEKLRRSRERVNYLDFFETVDIRHRETAYPDRVDIDVNVAEQSTGELNVGAGYSTYEGFLATADVKERNFLGRGQAVALSFSLSNRKQNYNFSFTEPWFLNRELSAGVNVYNQTTSYQDESSYDTGEYGAGLNFGFPLGEYKKDYIALSFKESKVNNVGTDASSFVQAETGKRSVLSLANTFVRDTRDSRILPTYGSRFSVMTQYAGFGTDTEFAKLQIGASVHHSVAKDWVLGLNLAAGGVYDMNKELPLSEHYGTGSLTLRGFDYGGIGPRDATTDDSLGGKYMGGVNAELRFPLGSAMKEAGVHGLFFVDSGIVTEFKDDPNVQDSGDFRVSAGTGIFWRSPMGPLRFEFGFPLVESEEDKSRVFSFSFGTRF